LDCSDKNLGIAIPTTAVKTYNATKIKQTTVLLARKDKKFHLEKSNFLKPPKTLELMN